MLTDPTPTIFVPYHAFDDLVRRGTRGTQPLATNVTPGALYSVTDEGNKVERSSGSAWELYAGSASLPGNIAYKDQANVFTTSQTIAGDLILNDPNPTIYFTESDAPANLKNWVFSVDAQEFRIYPCDDAWGSTVVPFTVKRNGQVQLAGINPTLLFGGATASYPALRNTGAVLEVISADTPASVFVPVRAGAYISMGSGTSLADLTVTGGTNFQSGITVTAGGGSITGTLVVNNLNVNTGNLTVAGSIQSGSYMYPGAVTAPGTLQGAWFLAGHSSYGLYTNTGLYVAGSIWTGTNIYAAGPVYDYGRSVHMGGWQALSVGAANFWSDTGGWAVTGPDTDYVYTLFGNTCIISVSVNASSLSAPGASLLYFSIPVTAVRLQMNVWQWFTGGAQGTAYVFTQPGVNYCLVVPSAGGVFPAASGTVRLYGQLAMQF